jgi:organic radical activating enzyme
MNYDEQLNDTKSKLEKVSPSFCLAKWLQVTIHLQFGGTHSCHHPDTHHIPLEEMANNPTALHNTSEKKQQRLQMLNGERHGGCDYCWKIEDIPGANFSDRIIKSNDDWARNKLQEIASMPWDENVTPTYVEVSFSNACNMKCLYCYPHISSSVHQEISTNGPYNLSYPHNNIEWFEHNKKKVIQHEDENPYVAAFWKWWPELYPNLKVFRITGGEPLLASSSFRVLDHIENHPNTDLQLSINSNLGVAPKIVEKLAVKVKAILDKKSIKRFQLYTSLDTWGTQAEYIRSGLDLKTFEANLLYLNNVIPEFRVTIMCTFNILSAYNFPSFLKKVLEWKNKLKENGGGLILDISFLRDPAFLNVHLLPKEHLHYIKESIRYMNERANTDNGLGFTPYETLKLNRVLQYYNEDPFPQQETAMNDFKLYVAEIDRRRGCSFANTFPELAQFMVKEVS